MSKIFNLKQAKRNTRRKKIITNILFTVTALYIIYAIYLTVKTPTDTIVVEQGNLTSDESITGYIIRDEVVIKGDNYKNGIYQILSEKDRAAKNQTIFRYYSSDEGELQKKIEEINQKIQTALEKENIFTTTDIKNIESQIDAKIQNLKTTNDVQELIDIKKQISDLVLKKATIAGENSKSGSYIKKLTEQREQYEKKLLEGSEYIVAPQSGIVSYRVDGLEEVLKPEGFEELTQEKLEALDIKTGKIVATSTETGKVINNFEGYIVAFFTSDASKQAEVGKNVLLTLASGNEISATIDYIKDQADEKKLIVFKVNTLTDELISYRKISLNVTWWSATGIKVPNESILEDEQGLKYVIKKTNSGNDKCYVNVLKTNDQFSIIKSYTNEELKEKQIDISTYKGIEIHDNIMLYPKK